MYVKTAYFGELEVEESKILFFPWGLPGFERLRRFILLEEKGFFWLQSVEEENIVFALCDPFLYFPDYEIDLSSSECKALGVTSHREVIVLAIMNILSDQEIGVNLLAPIVINCGLRIGKQVVLEGSPYGLRHILRLEGANATS